MKLFTDIPLCEPLDEFDWDHDEIRDLIQTTSVRFGDDGQPVGYDNRATLRTGGSVCRLTSQSIPPRSASRA